MAKTTRQFKCRDDLWARVEALAERRGISVDDVLQAALVQLFSKKKKKEPEEEAAAPAEEPAEPAKPQRAPTKPRVKPAGKPMPAPPPPRSAGRPSTRPGGAKLPRPSGGGAARLPPPGGARAAAPARARPLYLYFEGQVYSIDQEQFVIGRGAKYSDLAIKDANISRRHCAVVRRNGEYYIKDLGSTNGVEFDGERVDDHMIAEGSVYFLCDHELRFTFDAPA